MAGQFAGQDLSEIQFEGWLFSQEFTSWGLLFFSHPSTLANGFAQFWLYSNTVVW